MEEATQVDHKENKHQAPVAEQHVLDGEEALKSFQDEVAHNHLGDNPGEEGVAYDEAAHGASVEVVEEDMLLDHTHCVLALLVVAVEVVVARIV